MNLLRGLGHQRTGDATPAGGRWTWPSLTPLAPTGAGEPEEHAGNVLRMRWATAVGIVMWASFAAFDWRAAQILDDGGAAPLLVTRLGIVPLQLGVLWRLMRTPLVSSRELRLLDLLAFPLTAGAIGWMAPFSGGLVSPYVQGVYIVIMTRGAVLMQPWRQSWLPNAAIIAAHLAANLIQSALHPPLAAEFNSSLGQLISVGTHLSMSFAGVMMVLASHMAWALRRRVFQTRQLGQYKLDVPIGEGGHGQVWRAYHTGLNVSVAVKILKGDWRADSPQVQRFQREARATFALKHPNTVRMLDYGITVDGVCYLAMELLEGLTLAQLVTRDGPLEQGRAVHVVLQAANALAEAHGLGMVHRDVKPENLLITQVGHDADFCKLVDFGVAQVSGDLEHSLTGTGKVIGTPGYMPPEVLCGTQADPRADVYALGAVLHFALTGEAPRLFGLDADGARLKTMYIENASIARDLKGVLERCMSPSPARRYANASEFADHLRECSSSGARLRMDSVRRAQSLPTNPISE